MYQSWTFKVILAPYRKNIQNLEPHAAISSFQVLTPKTFTAVLYSKMTQLVVPSGSTITKQQFDKKEFNFEYLNDNTRLRYYHGKDDPPYSSMGPVYIFGNW